MSDEMFFSPDRRSLRRGRRVAGRTATCRPCLMWPPDLPEVQVQGVVLDISPFGMLVRTMEAVPVGTALQVQLMRDDQFQRPLSAPVNGEVVRQTPAQGLFVDHGIRVDQKDIPRAPAKVLRQASRPNASPRPRSRMHTIDITVGEGVRRK